MPSAVEHALEVVDLAVGAPPRPPSAAKPSTRSTSTRPYHERSSTAIPPRRAAAARSATGSGGASRRTSARRSRRRARGAGRARRRAAGSRRPCPTRPSPRRRRTPAARACRRRSARRAAGAARAAASARPRAAPLLLLLGEVEREVELRQAAHGPGIPPDRARAARRRSRGSDVERALEAGERAAAAVVGDARELVAAGEHEHLAEAAERQVALVLAAERGRDRGARRAGRDDQHAVPVEVARPRGRSTVPSPSSSASWIARVRFSASRLSTATRSSVAGQEDDRPKITKATASRAPTPSSARVIPPIIPDPP